MSKKSILLTSSIFVSFLAAPAFAQVQDEIIVTATKRTTTLQETPIAVTVTSGELIEKAKILDIQDLQSVVPSLRVNQLQTSQNTNFVIRGFGNGANNAGIEPSVGVFVDGVYRSRSAAQIGDLPKLERVEVLKGPQSTLFGKNASAGVISVVTAAPSFESQGYAEIGYGNYNAKSGKFYLTGGLSDTVAVSIGAGINKRDGYFENVIDGVDDFNDRDRFYIRGQALYEPTDNISFRTILDYSSIDENCCGVSYLQTTGAGFAVQALGGQFGGSTDGFTYRTAMNRNSDNTVDDYGISFHADVDLGVATLTSISSYRHNDSTFDQDADFNTLALLDSVNQDQQIDTVTQEIRLTSNGGDRIDWMVGGYFFNEDITQIGGLEYGADLQNYINVLLQGPTGIPGLLTTVEGLYGFGPGTFLGAGTTTREAFTQDNSAYSAFATVDFHVTDRLTATVGVNYTKDKKEINSNVVNGDIFSSIDLFNDPTVFGVALPQVFFGQFFTANTGLAPTPQNIAFIESVAPGTSAAVQAGANAVIAGIQTTQFQPQFVNFPNSVESGRTNDDKVTYTLRLGYDVNDSINVYGSYATGFKATSWNLSRDSRPFLTDQAALTAAGLTQNNQTYGTRFAGPEEATVIEIGLKTRWDWGTLNLAAFDQSLDGFQSNVFQGTGFNLLNAGKATTQGFEFDGTLSPFQGLTFTYAGTLLDAKYDEFTAEQGAAQYLPNADGTFTLTPTDFSGKKVDGVSEVSLSLGANYTQQLSNGMEAYIQGDFQYESDTPAVDGFNNSNFTSAGSLNREVKTFNASAGLDLGNGLALQVYGRNLFNDEYLLSVFPGVAQTGVINGYPNAPRTYGAALRYNF